MAGPRPTEYNPLSPEVCADPYPYYAALRRESPVHPIVPGFPFYAVSRFQDVHHILESPDLFSSTAWRALTSGAVPLGPNTGTLADHRVMKTPSVISIDPPSHGPIRGLVNRGFTPRRISALEPRLLEIVVELLDATGSEGAVDVMADLAVPYPVTVIAELLGVESSHRERFKRWSDAIISGVSGTTQKFTEDEVRDAADEMAAYVDRVIAERRQTPRDDLVSVLVRAEEGEKLSTEEVLAFINLLLIAGNETTTNLIGNATKALLEYPDQLKAVQDEPARIPAMIEEALRFDSPVQGVPRQVRESVELSGVELPKDAFVLVLLGSANRDEDQYPDPDVFDPERPAASHVAFGFGVHFCLGAALARLEAKVAFEEMFLRWRDLALDEIDVPVMNSGLLRGPQRLPVTFKRA